MKKINISTYNNDEIKTKTVLRTLENQAKKERTLCMQSAASMVVTAGAVGILHALNMPETIELVTCASAATIGAAFAINRAFLADKAAQKYKKIMELNKSLLKAYAMESELARAAFIQTYPNLSGKLNPVLTKSILKNR